MTKARYLPVQPLRDALVTLRTHESYLSMARRLAAHTDRSQRTCQRLIERILKEHETIHEITADEVCMYVLGMSGVEVFGVEIWATGDTQEHDD